MDPRYATTEINLKTHNVGNFFKQVHPSERLKELQNVSIFLKRDDEIKGIRECPKDSPEDEKKECPPDTELGEYVLSRINHINQLIHCMEDELNDLRKVIHKIN
jgi:hypothetical protein